MCTLRISGLELDADALLQAHVDVRASVIHRKGHPSTKGRNNLFTSIAVTVSDAPFSDLRSQIADALAFLQTHTSSLEKIAAFPGVDHVVLDFAIEGRGYVVESDSFPATLLAQLGRFGFDLEVSRYPQSS